MSPSAADQRHRWARWPARLAAGIEALLFAALFGVLLTQIGTRFLLDRPAAWTEELAAALFIWVIFWSAAFCAPLGDHVALDLLESRLSPRWRRISEAFGMALIAGCFAWALPGILDYLSFMQREPAPVTGWPMLWHFGIFGAFAAMVVLRCTWAIWRPVRPPIDPPADPKRP